MYLSCAGSDLFLREKRCQARRSNKVTLDDSYTNIRTVLCLTYLNINVSS